MQVEMRLFASASKDVQFCAERAKAELCSVHHVTRVWISSFFVLFSFFGLDLMVVDIN